MRHTNTQGMRIIGITGGVGAGKSEILDFLRNRYEAHVIQADEVGHLVIEMGTEGYQKVLDVFGQEILRPDGAIDRGILGGIVFSDPAKREALNQIIHPAVKAWIRREIERKAQEGECRLLVIEAALLIEDHYEELCEEFWYIYTEEGERRERLKASRGYSDEKISAIFASQSSDQIFREHCQVVIDNNGSIEDTYRQIENLLD